jgi:hypothetical protein
MGSKGHQRRRLFNEQWAMFQATALCRPWTSAANLTPSKRTPSNLHISIPSIEIIILLTKINNVIYAYF